MASEVRVAFTTFKLAGGSVPAVFASTLEFGSQGESSGEMMASLGIAWRRLWRCLSGRRSKYSSETAITRIR